MSRIYACVYIVLYNNNNVDGKKANLHIICRIHEYQQNWVHYQVSSQELYGMNYHTYTLLAWKLNRIIVRSHITSSGMWCIATKYTCRIANFLKHSKYMDTFWAKQMRHIGSIAKNQEKGGRRQREKRIRAHSNNLEFFFCFRVQSLFLFEIVSGSNTWNYIVHQKKEEATAQQTTWYSNRMTNVIV